ncbi:MAG: YeeE/YedE family protein [Alphaproteobacteria bacterium]
MEDLPITTVVASLGFGLGLVFGVTVQRSNFCTMGSISDIVFMGDWNRFRAWMLAIAVAVLGSQALHVSETVDLGETIYLTTNLGWFGAVLGGLMFGFGMTMTGGCANKTLVRIGGGNLKSVIVFLFMGIFAYMTLRGLTGMARVRIEGFSNLDLEALGLESQGIPDILSALLGLPTAVARGATVLVLAGGLLWFCFRSAAFRASRRDVAAGLILGALVPAGWYATGVIGYDEFEPLPLTSYTFVAPAGNAIQYLMTFTGSTIDFGIAAVGGVIAGGFLAAKASGQFRIEAFLDAADMQRHIFGGALMGMGGIMALGCTIGQGVTGLSTLAIGSVIALTSIVAGGVFGMKYLEEGSFGGAFKAILARG